MTTVPFSARYIYIILFLITIFGAFLRINASLQTVVEFPFRADAGQYFSYAFNLRHYGIYSRDSIFMERKEGVLPSPDAMRSPGYALFLIPFAGKLPTNKTILDITLMQALVSTLIIPTIFVIGRKLLPEPWYLLPTLLVAISPHLISAGTYVLSEIVFSFLMLTGLVSLIVQFQNPKRYGLAIVSGVLISLATLTRPTLQYFLLFVLIFMLPLLPVKYRWKQAGGLLLGFLIVFGPWIVRNIVTLGITSDPTLEINSLVHGHYPNVMYDGRSETIGYPYRFDPKINELSASKAAAFAGIWEQVKAAPFTCLFWYLIGKPTYFLSWVDVTGAGDVFTYPTPQSPYLDSPLFLLTKVIMHLTHWLWMILSLIAMAQFIFSLHNRRNMTPEIRITMQLLVCIGAYFLAVHVAGFSIARYNTPLLPVHYLLATYCIISIVKKLKVRRSSQPLV